jgi:NAD(P)-dependent dehydrogenase (short-subunit alcohol dehydrogenase family)
MTGDLKNDVALVTGALGVIGRVIVETLKRRGATVIVSDILSGPPGTLRLDVTSEAEWTRAIDGIRREHGRLDILVNCAGIAPMGRIEDTPLAEWRQCQATNVEGIFLSLKAAARLLADSGRNRVGGASVINISSGAADRGAAWTAAYCTSKAAATMLTRVAAVEFAALGYPVRVNAVHPGAVESTMMDSIFESYSKIMGGVPISELRQAINARVPLGRLVDPAEVADAVAFLASAESRFVHGTSIHVDGGYTA